MQLIENTLAQLLPLENIIILKLFRPKQRMCLRTSTIKPLAWQGLLLLLLAKNITHLCPERWEGLSVQFFHLSHLHDQRSQNKRI